MVVLVLGLGVLMNNIRLDEEDTLGYSVDSFDSMTCGKTCGFISRKSLE